MQFLCRTDLPFRRELTLCGRDNSKTHVPDWNIFAICVSNQTKDAMLSDRPIGTLRISCPTTCQSLTSTGVTTPDIVAENYACRSIYSCEYSPTVTSPSTFVTATDLCYIEKHGTHLLIGGQ